MVLFTLYAAAVAEKKRESMPQVGINRDRRSLQHVGEVLHEEAIGVLMCFVCACKHLRYTGYDLFGRPEEKGKISYQSAKPFLYELLHGSEEKSSADVAFDYNLSVSFFKKRRLHEAVERDPHFCDVSDEWCRTVRRNHVVECMLCRPEDVHRGEKCRHEATEVCWRCQIPLCTECNRLLQRHEKIRRL